MRHALPRRMSHERLDDLHDKFMDWLAEHDVSPRDRLAICGYELARAIGDGAPSVLVANLVLENVSIIMREMMADEITARVRH